ncbi:MAG TPA: tryptophan synthase subunit alpha [archaeon]|nr:tryptophan synthase subunit alpha [archaeon]
MKSQGRYAQTFFELAKKQKGAFIPFVVLGDPTFEDSKKVLRVLARNADCLELGFPFSDPIADGKRIASADQRSLKSGMSTEKCFELISQLRSENSKIPIGLLLYYNLVYTNGAEKFLKRAKECGVDGILIADMPLEESGEIKKLCKKIGLDLIFIISPLTGVARMKKILKCAGGFVYIVGVLGVTGERKSIEDGTIDLLQQVKKNTSLPCCIGFGISEPSHVEKIIKSGSDGAIVGSAIEAIIEKNIGNESQMLLELENFAKEMNGAGYRGAQNRKN